MAQSPASIDPQFHYPLPEGKYQVGTRFLTLSDISRPDIYKENKEDFRQLSLRIWYPANPKTGSQPLSNYKKPVAHNFIEMGLFYDAFLQNIALQTSCSFLDQYLKGIPSFAPEKLEDQYEEVRIKTITGPYVH